MEAGHHPVYRSRLLQKELSFPETIIGLNEWRLGFRQNAVLDEQE